MVWGVVSETMAVLDQLSETPSGHTHILGLARIHLYTFESMTATHSSRPALHLLRLLPKAGKRTKMATLARDLGDYVLRAPPGGSGSQS
ncbi:hypothetical protein Pcinc_030975 [Petrolisthes cinctipes]|uniref:Uncharacterized protein n=1 Tax=Petrolisthes cinctipes TaxID=88211 RepID=A0AAE1EXL2_PETCI|nr:hypothetical protein Pcinc_030975 [Petrolisthes cinctipes]